MQTITIHANSTSARLMAEIEGASLNISLPGHDGVPIQDSYSLPNLCDYVISRIGNGECILIGNSLGGMLAHQIADRVRPKAIISVAMPPLNYEVLEGFMHENQYTAIAGKADLEEEEIQQLVKAVVEEPEKQAIVADSIRRSDPRIRSGLFESIMGGDLRDEREILRNLDIPMLFVACERDPIVNNAKFEDLDFGEVRHVDANHLLPFENPDFMNEIIGEFLAKHGLSKDQV